MLFMGLFRENFIIFLIQRKSFVFSNLFSEAERIFKFEKHSLYLRICSLGTNYFWLYNQIDFKSVL